MGGLQLREQAVVGQIEVSYCDVDTFTPRRPYIPGLLIKNGSAVNVVLALNIS